MQVIDATPGQYVEGAYARHTVKFGGLIQCTKAGTMLGELIAVQYAKSLIDTFKDDMSADVFTGKRIAVVLSGGATQPAQVLVPFQ